MPETKRARARAGTARAMRAGAESVARADDMLGRKPTPLWVVMVETACKRALGLDGNRATALWALGGAGRELKDDAGCKRAPKRTRRNRAIVVKLVRGRQRRHLRIRTSVFR